MTSSPGPVVSVVTVWSFDGSSTSSFWPPHAAKRREILPSTAKPCGLAQSVGNWRNRACESLLESESSTKLAGPSDSCFCCSENQRCAALMSVEDSRTRIRGGIVRFRLGLDLLRLTGTCDSPAVMYTWPL